MSGITLNSVHALPDPAPAWRWLVRMPSLGGGALSPLYVEEIELPWDNVTAQGRYTGGTRTYYPDIADVTATTITFYEDVNYTVFRYITYWRSLVRNQSNGTYGLPYGGPGGGYKKRITWELFNGVTTSPALSGYLDGAFPTELTPFSLNFNSSERIRVACSFSLDGSYVTGGGGGGGGSVPGMRPGKGIAGTLANMAIGAGVKALKRLF